MLNLISIVAILCADSCRSVLAWSRGFETHPVLSANTFGQDIQALALSKQGVMGKVEKRAREKRKAFTDYIRAAKKNWTRNP